MSRRLFSGIAASKGIGIGKCLMIGREEEVQHKSADFEGGQPVAAKDEAKLFDSALRQVQEELENIQTKVEAEAGSDAAAIFDAQKLILLDPLFTNEVREMIGAKHLPAAEAVRQTITDLRGRFASLSSHYIREREEDFIDLGSKLIDVIRGTQEDLDSLTREAEREHARIVLVSISPSTAIVARLGKKLIAGILTETGSRTSHLAIVARSLGIPAVLGVENVVREIKGGDLVLVDGDRGRVVLHPSKGELREAEKRIEPRIANATSWVEPTRTIDGHRVSVFANAADLQSVREASVSGAEGIGLFRTEFLYFDRRSPPNEDELYEVIRECILLMRGRQVVIRTLDLGGDKKPDYLEFPKERSPVLGLRGIRHSLKNPVLLESQLTAILRASVEGKVSIMFPMISTMNELNDARQIVDQVKRRLERKGSHISPKVRIGVMIETPSAALMSDKLADVADFFSLGTNDLVQYTLAADRENENVAAMADPLEPSVLRLIDQTVKNAHVKKRHVALCGEMAADLEAVPILVGLGLDQLSVIPSCIDSLRKTIQSIRYSAAEKFAAKALSMSSAADIRSASSKIFQTGLAHRRETT